MGTMNAPKLAALAIALLADDAELEQRLQPALDQVREEHRFPGAGLGTFLLVGVPGVDRIP